MIKEIVLLADVDYMFANRKVVETIGYAIIKYSNNDEMLKPISFNDSGDQQQKINGYSLQDFYDSDHIKVTDKRNIS